MTAKPSLRLPKHLKPATRRWAEGILSDFVLESHHFRLLVLACQAWDRGDDARAALVESGSVFLDRFGQPRARPEVAIERDARIAFARLVRELALDVDEPNDTRPPTIRGSAVLRRTP
jgi:phage terminase small subunit